MSQKITVTAIVAAPVEEAWELWIGPEHIVRWNSASDDWRTTRAENDARESGRFNFRMESVDGTQGFDFGGTYTAVEPGARLAYRMDDGREAEVTFAAEGSGTRVTETFDPENQNPPEMQRAGWQAILERFAAYASR